MVVDGQLLLKDTDAEGSIGTQISALIVAVVVLDQRFSQPSQGIRLSRQPGRIGCPSMVADRDSRTGHRAKAVPFELERTRSISVRTRKIERSDPRPPSES